MMQEEKTAAKLTLREVLKSPVLRLSLLIGIGLHASQQLSGINVVSSIVLSTVTSYYDC